MGKSKIFWFEYAIKALATELDAWRRHRDRSPAQMGIAMRFAARTWARRIADPESLTVAEMWRAINYLKIPPDEAVQLMTAGIESLKK